MPHGRPLLSTTTRLYGHFTHGTTQRPLAGPIPLFNALLDERGVDALYVPLQVSADHFESVVMGMRRLRDIAGFTVTMPHKVAAARLCDELLPNARACGAVNVVRVDRDGRLIGETFDGIAMVHAIRKHQAIGASTRVLLVGAGGVGQAIGVALALAGVSALTIVNRTQARADDLVQKVRRAAASCKVEASSPAAVDPAGFDVIINATSLGSSDGQGPLPVDVSRVSTSALVAEVVVVPEYTPLLRAARERGLDVVRGMEMITPQIEICAEFLGMTAPGRP